MNGRDHFLTGITQRIVDDEGKLDEATLLTCLEQALDEYGQRRPRHCVEDIEGGGIPFLTLPAEWEEGVSRLIKLEELNTEGTPDALHPGSYLATRTPDGSMIVFLSGVARHGVLYRVHFTARHTISADSSTVPSADEAALMDLAASHAMLRLAAAYTQSIDQTIGTELIDFKHKSSEYLTLSKELRTHFAQLIGITPFPGASRQTAWNREQTLMFHR